MKTIFEYISLDSSMETSWLNSKINLVWEAKYKDLERQTELEAKEYFNR